MGDMSAFVWGLAMAASRQENGAGGAQIVGGISAAAAPATTVWGCDGPGALSLVSIWAIQDSGMYRRRFLAQFHWGSLVVGAAAAVTLRRLTRPATRCRSSRIRLHYLSIAQLPAALSRPVLTHSRHTPTGCQPCGRSCSSACL